MKSTTLLFSALLTSAHAFPGLAKRQLPTAPAVTIKNGTVVGSSSEGLDTFQGIPFALPPTGTLRLKPPHYVNATFGTFTATATPSQCPQMLTSSIDLTNVPANASYLLDDLQASPEGQEDCLTLDVVRPTGTTSTSALPVLVWIYGGGFEFGSTQNYNGDEIVTKSITLGQEIIYVAMNYRLNGFGFLAGKELQAEGSTNLGLRDQRLAIEWVAENIAAFGGDPNKVTIWGESAGSISVYDQTIINGGDNTYNGKPLFRGAIMDSGSLVPALNVSNAKPQAVYDTVVNAAGCSSAADTLACLRSLPYATFYAAVTSLPGIFSYSGVNLAYLPRPDPDSKFFPLAPEVVLYEGKYAKVPIIIGDQEDEGTLFSLVQDNLTTAAETDAYIASAFPETAASITDGYCDTYSSDPADGSPFNTGDLNEIYPQYKRLAAITGDITFTLKRRQYLNVVSHVVNAWSYLDSHLYGTAVLGTFHSSDLLESFDDGVPSEETADAYTTYYVSFVNSLNPNTISTTFPLIEWPQYNTTIPELLQLQAVSNNLLPDTFRAASYNYLQQYPYEFRS